MKKWVEMFNTLARKEGEKQTKEEEDAAYIDDDDIYEDAVERTGAPCIPITLTKIAYPFIKYCWFSEEEVGAEDDDDIYANPEDVEENNSDHKIKPDDASPPPSPKLVTNYRPV